MISVFLYRVFRAIKIDVDLYEEVEADKKATFQAAIVVVLIESSKLWNSTTHLPELNTISRLPTME